MNNRAIQVRYLAGDRLQIDVGGHSLFADQPLEGGGDGTAPTPTEIFLGGLAACVAYYAERFLRRHDLAADGLKVTCGYGWAESPHRVGWIEIDVQAPGLVPEKQAAFSKVIERCTLHNTLQLPPTVQIQLTTVPAAVA